MTNNMEKFNFYLDQKVTTWMRTNFSVEAESSEIARQKAIDFVKEGNALELSWEEVMDTKEIMSLKDNGGEPTEEIFEEDGDIIYVNKNKDE
jgi:gamma-glutamylcysteine synthetase